VLDLMKWDRALYGDAVSAADDARAHVAHRCASQRPAAAVPLRLRYGENSRLRDQRLVEYDGNWQGFQAVMSRYVE